MSESHRHQSIGFLEDAHVQMLALDGLLESEEPSSARSSAVAGLHQQIGRSLKLAQIHAHLAIAESISAVQLQPAEVHNLVHSGAYL